MRPGLRPLLLAANAATQRWAPRTHVCLTPRVYASPTARQTTRGWTRLFSAVSGSLPSVEGLPDLFPYKEGQYNSASINAGKVRAQDTADFAAKLSATVAHLQREEKSAVWLKVPMDYAHYLPVAARAAGFRPHHALPDAVLMVRWLLDGVPDKVPPFATHHVGVAGCVLDARGRVLVVKERHPRALWKFPGGLAEAGEDLGAAAAREVEEETGVRSAFAGLLAFRQQHAMQFGNSDLYFICRMTRRTGEGEGDGEGEQELRPCAHEIAEARWMPLEEFAAQNTHPMMGVVAKMLMEGPQNHELKEETQESIFGSRPPYKMYYHASDAQAQ
ncbi:nucleoside diphosphate linked moiety X-type motif 6 [Tribonema minus]|uniref:Nucleoside diphosphate-linked moiety X motif 6 n=1 Tax=Tribonema minus TaxID=303371 RepID=A0A836C878_9STRA|nr:nucleoside diphosphate linked moiety X-type motif 6 [Tribonema minus]